MNKYYTVEQIAEMLTMHPKTIQRYIREGKLKANKVGKSWRVTGHDLSEFTENVGVTGHDTRIKPQDKVTISCVVDIAVSEADEGMRIINLLTAALNCKPEKYGLSTMHTQYLEYENKVRVTLWGRLLFMKEMLEFISTATGQTIEENMEEQS